MAALRQRQSSLLIRGVQSTVSVGGLPASLFPVWTFHRGNHVGNCSLMVTGWGLCPENCIRLVPHCVRICIFLVEGRSARFYGLAVGSPVQPRRRTSHPDSREEAGEPQAERGKWGRKTVHQREGCLRRQRLVAARG